MKVVGNVEGIAFVHFDDKDVVRHPLVQQIVKVYEAYGGSRQYSRGSAVTVTDGRRPRACARPASPPGSRASRRRAPRGDLAIALVSDARIRALNRQFRRKDAATDVLSFPADVRLGLATAARHLGDIVIATGRRAPPGARGGAFLRGRAEGPGAARAAAPSGLRSPRPGRPRPDGAARAAAAGQGRACAPGLIERAGRGRVRGSDD